MLLSFAWTLTHPTTNLYLQQNIVFSYLEMIPVSSSFFPYFSFLCCVILLLYVIVLLSLIFFSKKNNLICSCFVMFYVLVFFVFFFGGWRGGGGVDTFSLKLPSIRYQKIKIPIFEDFLKNKNLPKICFKMVFYKDHHRMITPDSNNFQRQYNIDPMPHNLF